MKYFIIFPNQLFKNTTNLKNYDKILLIEDPLYFSDKERVYKFNAIKLVYQRGCFKYYENFLKNKNIKTQYYNFDNYKNLVKKIKKENKGEFYTYNPFDKLLIERYKKDFKIEVIDSPHFVDTEEQLKEYYKSKKNKLFQTSFYSYQRKKLDILLDKNNKPLGGKLTYDINNRDKLPKNIKIPEPLKFKDNKYIKEARTYVKKNIVFIGDLEGTIRFPTNHKDSIKWYKNFLKDRLKKFGQYQDAITLKYKDNPFLFHSGISPAFNVGFLTQQEIIDLIIKEYKKRKLPLNSVEGLIRQIIGWNSFCRAYYVNIDTKIEKNFFNFKRKLNDKWYTGDTGIQIVDDTIKSAFKNGYLHHIQRLMIILNIMILCEIDYKEQYRWHMEYSLDSYDYLMIYNIYSMGYGDGGLTTTKPYISSPAYLLRMSDYSSSGNWTNIWEALYYNFLDKQKNKLKKNPRMRAMYIHYNKKTKKELEEYRKIAQKFIKKVTKYG